MGSAFSLQSIWDAINHTIYDYGLDIIAALIILMVGLWVAGRIRNAFDKILARRQMDKTVRIFFRQVLYICLIILVTIMALSKAGVQTASVIAVLATASFAVALSLKGSLSNLASGIILIVIRPFKVGDYVDIGGVSGTVQAIEMMFTYIKTPDSKSIAVPNGKITSSSITNFSEYKIRRSDFVVGISYDDDLRKAKEILQSVVDLDERILKEPSPPQIVVRELADNSVNIMARYWTSGADIQPVCYDLTEKVKLAFDEAGITIPYPQQDIYMHSVVKQ